MVWILNVHMEAQGIQGQVVESFSREGIRGVEIGIYHGDSLLTHSSSKPSGLYNVKCKWVGRVSIRITHKDFMEVVEQDIFLDGYSTVRLNYMLQKKISEGEEITITGNQSRNSDFVRIITPGDMALVAGSFDDPVRVAHSEPGIVLLNDLSNHFSARGQSPLFNSWYLEGLQIVNPNHTNNVGIEDDDPTIYGGGVNMFSGQTLSSTDLYLGVNPYRIGNVTGAAINMHLYETAKPEWRAKVGFLGFEFGGGVALGKQGVVDFNLRYSLTSLLPGLGTTIEGEKVGFYDGVLSYSHSGKRHHLKLFAWMGKSENHFDRVENPDDQNEYKDLFDIDYTSRLLGTGLRYDVSMGPSLSFRSGFAYSTNPASFSKYGFIEGQLTDYTQEGEISILSSFLETTIRHSKKVHSTLGIQYDNRSYSEFQLWYYPLEEESTLRAYYFMSIAFASKWNVELGGDIRRSGDRDDDMVPGYRAEITCALAPSQKLFAGLRHGAGPFLYRRYNIISDTYELGWSSAGKSQNAQLNLYYQQMHRLHAYYLSSTEYEYLADYPNDVFAGILGINSNGVSQQYGIEGSWGIRFENGFRGDINQSVYKSLRGLKGEAAEPGRYDGRYATHVSVSKEIIGLKNDKNRLWNFSLRAILNGGLWDPQIGIGKSEQLGVTVFRYPPKFDHLPAYKRIDACITRTISTDKTRWQFKLDIQNLFGFSNIAYYYYDDFLNQVVAQEQLGIVPVLSAQVSW